MPNPPNCIRQRIVIWPNLVKSLPVSRTISPVQEAAEVAVKSESMKLILPFTVEGPKYSARPPEKIKSIKLEGIIKAGFENSLICMAIF